MGELKKCYKWIGFFLLMVIIQQNFKVKTLIESMVQRNYFKRFNVTSGYKNFYLKKSTEKKEYGKYSIYKLVNSPKHQKLNEFASSIFTEADFQQLCSQPPVSDLTFSCRDHLSWTDRVQNSSHLRTQANASLFQFIIYQKSKMASKELKMRDFVGYIKIKTVDMRGFKKAKGGDWWRATVIGENQQKSLRWSVRINDQNDGSYVGVFPIRFSGKFRLEIYLEYSLCEGILDPPFDWFSKGE